MQLDILYLFFVLHIHVHIFHIWFLFWVWLSFCLFGWLVVWLVDGWLFGWFVFWLVGLFFVWLVGYVCLFVCLLACLFFFLFFDCLSVWMLECFNQGAGSYPNCSHDPSKKDVCVCAFCYLLLLFYTRFTIPKTIHLPTLGL